MSMKVMLQDDGRWTLTVCQKQLKHVEDDDESSLLRRDETMKAEMRSEQWHNSATNAVMEDEADRS